MVSATPDLRLPSQPNSTATAPWQVLISHPAEGSRLSWLVTYNQDGIPANGHPSVLTEIEVKVAAWRSGNVVGRINEVTLRRARLVLG